MKKKVLYETKNDPHKNKGKSVADGPRGKEWRKSGEIVAEIEAEMH